MKTKFLTLVFAALALASQLLAPPAASAQEADISISATATLSEELVILDVYANVSGVALRSFGIGIRYERQQLEPRSMVRYEGIWYLADGEGSRYAYGQAELVEPGLIRVVGGRLDGRQPDAGVSGPMILLATIEFSRFDNSEPKFEFGFASPQPYVNFAAAGEGGSLDPIVHGLEDEVVLQRAAVDEDGDGLPDDYEEAVFGSTRVSDGTGDSDADGCSDLDEWRAGTDPTDRRSKLTLQVIPQPDGSTVLQWTSQPGRVYDLLWSSSLDAFDAIFAGVPGTPPRTSRVDAAHTSFDRGFFRVRVTDPTPGR